MFFFLDDLLGHVAEVHIHQDIHVLAAAIATLAPAVVHPASRQARLPSKPALLLSSVSRKRLKLRKLLPRPRTAATHLLLRRLPQHTRPAPSPITPPERFVLPLHHSQRKVRELPHQASLSLLQRGRPRGQTSTSLTETKMWRGKKTLYNGTRGKHRHLARAKRRNEPLVHLFLPCHCPQPFLRT